METEKSAREPFLCVYVRNERNIVEEAKLRELAPLFRCGTVGLEVSADTKGR